MNKDTRIYGAYGSNMNLQQMRHRCPDAKVIGTGKLRNYRLTFRGVNKGVANIERSQGRAVPIVLWEITPECERALDLYERYPRLYVKREIDVATGDRTIKAMVYVMVKEYESLPAEPVRYYLDVIRQGYEDNKIPLKALRKAVAENVREISDKR